MTYIMSTATMHMYIYIELTAEGSCRSHCQLQHEQRLRKGLVRATRPSIWRAIMLCPVRRSWLWRFNLLLMGTITSTSSLFLPPKCWPVTELVPALTAPALLLASRLVLLVHTLGHILVSVESGILSQGHKATGTMPRCVKQAWSIFHIWPTILQRYDPSSSLSFCSFVT